MRVSDPGASLRPLGLGEILDRAVNLCVKFFAPLTLIYVWYAIPLAVVTYFSTQSFTRIIDVFRDSVSSGHKLNQDQVAAALQGQPTDILWSLLAFFFAVFVAPLPSAALIEATTAFYLGRASSVKQAYRVAVDRYWNMLGITLLFLLCGLVLYGVFTIAILVGTLVFVLLASASQTLAVILGVIVGIVAVVLVGAIGIVFLFALQISYFSCVVERANAAAAVGRSMKRAFSGIGLRRTLLIGLVYVAIFFGIALVSAGGQAVVIGLLRSPVLGAIFQTVVRLCTAAFTTAFIGIFYLDLRVREEGLDLALASDRAEAQPYPAP